jgi:hypothetical protein
MKIKQTLTGITPKKVTTCKKIINKEKNVEFFFTFLIELMPIKVILGLLILKEIYQQEKKLKLLKTI